MYFKFQKEINITIYEKMEFLKLNGLIIYCEPVERRASKPAVEPTDRT